LAVKFSANRWSTVFALLGILLLIGACRTARVTGARESSNGIRILGPGSPPHLGFACCEYGVEQMQSLFAQPDLIETLKDLHAAVAIPTQDFSPQRAGVVRLLHRAGVPVIAWIVLSREQGYFLTVDNGALAAARIADFERWTHDYGLQWVAVGLDVEPNFPELAQLRGHWWHLVMTLLRRSVNGGRIRRAREVYSQLVDQIRSRGYPVQIYQMPYIPAERSAHSSLPDRLLGTLDVRGDEEYLMLYTSNARPVGAGMIWSLGVHAWGITIGSTDGDTTPGTGNGPLDWEEFRRDLIVASHFTKQIGVYDLEGCVRQGFLPRLQTMDWSQSVTIPEASVRRAVLIRFFSRSTLWIGSNLIYFLLAAGILLLTCLFLRRRFRRKRFTKRPRNFRP
jgi:hypothetical protein